MKLMLLFVTLLKMIKLDSAIFYATFERIKLLLQLLSGFAEGSYIGKWKT